MSNQIQDYKELKAHYHTWPKETLLNIVNFIYGAKMMLFSLNFDFIFNYMCIYTVPLFIPHLAQRTVWNIVISWRLSTTINIFIYLARLEQNFTGMIPFRTISDELCNMIAVDKKRKGGMKSKKSSPLKVLCRIEQIFS